MAAEATERASNRERGETLVELIVSIAILGIAGVAIISGMLLSVKSSDLGRKQATGSAYVRSFAEAIQQSVDINGGYAACGAAVSTYRSVAVPGFGAGDTAGYTKDVVAIHSWTGTAWGACSATGIQKVTLTVTSTGDAVHKATETLEVVLRKPCNGAASASADDPCAP